MTHKHYYKIGGHRIAIEAHEGLLLTHLLPTYSPFAAGRRALTHFSEGTARATGGGQPCLFVLRVADAPRGDDETVNSQCTRLTDFEWEGGQCTVWKRPAGRLSLRLLAPQSQQWGQMEVTGDSATAWLPAKSDAAAFVLNNFLMMLYAFTSAKQYTLLMHASVVCQQGQAYVFLGPSGTGKSTHSTLWLRHIPGSELLNDDNPILRIDPHTRQLTAYGSPWSGKTPCYRTEQVPVAAIVRLSQAPENQIEQQDAAHAFATLLPSCSCLKQEQNIYNGVLQTVCDIVQQTPIYRLECLPDRAAAKLCYRTAAMQAGTYPPQHDGNE